MVLTKFDSRQSINRAALAAIGTSANAGLDSVFSGINTLFANATSAATASVLMKRDANSNTQVNNLIENITSTATAGGTTTLTVSSTYFQQFTGTSAQTVVLPNATTLTIGQAFYITNRSTGYVTVNKNGGSLAVLMAPNSQTIMTVSDISSAAGIWDSSYGVAGPLPFLQTTAITDSTTTGASATLAAGDIVDGVVRLTNVSLTSISGIPAGVSGQSIVVENQTGTAVTIKNNDAGASAANRIMTGTGSAITMSNNATFTFTYDATTSLWMVTGGAGSGGLSAWAISTPYLAGAVVTYEKNAYICITANTSGSTFEADVLLNYWRLLNQPSIAQNIMLVGNNFEDGDVGGWTAVNSALTNGLPSAVGSGGAAFSSSNGGTAKGANTSAPAVVSSGQLSGAYSLSLATTGAGTIGDGYISQAYPIDIKFQAKVLSFSFSYKSVTGTPDMSGTSSNTYACAIYDVTNNAWIGAAGNFNFVQGSGVGTCSGTFQTNSTTASIQIFVYSPVAPVGASSLYLDDFYIGPQAMSYGPAMGDWQPYTVGITGSVSNPVKGTLIIDQGYWRRVGDSVEIRYQYDQTGAGSAGSGTYQFNLPSGITIDLTKFNAAQNNQDLNFGSGVTLWTGGNATHVSAIAGVISNSGFSLQATSYGPFGSSNGSLSNAAVRIGIDAMFPVTGWSSNSVQSADTDTRVVQATYYLLNGSANLSVTSNTSINYDTKITDTHGAVTVGGGTWKFTAPVVGLYEINTTLQSAATASSVNLYKNGADYLHLTYVASGGLAPATATVLLNAGDYIDLRPSITSSWIGQTLTGSNQPNVINIKRLSGPAVVQASEKIRARYNGSSGTSLANIANTIVDFNTKDYDTHGAVTTGASWKFVAPRSDFYTIRATVTTSSSTAADNAIVIFKNGSLYATADERDIRFDYVFGAPPVSVYLLSGDYIDVRVYQASGGAITVLNNLTSVYVEIESK
jgi:hypothetical protein